jgi:hypothetical protein
VSDRTALHEAGHAQAAVALGYESLGVSVSGGVVLAGCSQYRLPAIDRGVWDAAMAALAAGLPMVTWPGEVIRAIQGAAVITAAGEAAEVLAGPVEGRVPEPVSERAAELLAELADLPEPAAEDIAVFASAVR